MIICGIGIIMVLLIAVVIAFISDNYITYANYAKIQNGMQYKEVVKILHKHFGKLWSSARVHSFNIDLYIWENRTSTRCIAIEFKNGIVYNKEQFGLKNE